MRKLAIQVRLLIAVFVIIVSTTFVLGYIGVNMINQFVQSRFEERIMFLARYLALNSELGILIGEQSLLERLARNLLSEKDVVRVSIVDIFDNPLAEVSKKVNGSLNAISVPVILKESREESMAFSWSDSDHPGNEIIGKVKITYSTEGIRRLLELMKIRFLWISVGIACISFLIFYFISKSLIAPVTQLAQAARQVAKGDLDLRVELGNLPETRELATAFNAMLDSLAESSKALDAANQEMIRQKMLAEMGKFSLMIAHEVKNPLSIIKSSLDILKKDIGPLADDMMITYIEDEIKRLNRLIEDFLSFARPAMPSFRRIDVNSMLVECIERFEIQMTDKPVVIERNIPDMPCFIEADPDLLNRAIGNIIKNALEAGNGNGKIEIDAVCEKNQWVLKISDRGGGIDPENIDSIFEPFFTTRAKGTGLGLAYTHQVITAHGGSVSAENNKSGGAVFKIVLPAPAETISFDGE